MIGDWRCEENSVVARNSFVVTGVGSSVGFSVDLFLACATFAMIGVVCLAMGVFI